jgi:hypothetical protein
VPALLLTSLACAHATIPVVCRGQLWWDHHERSLLATATSPLVIAIGSAAVLGLGWAAWRQSMAGRGKDLVPLRQAVAGWVRFSLFEDVRWWRITTAIGLVLAGGCWLAGWHSGGLALGVGLLAVGLGRWGRVHRARRRVLAQMLNVAAAHLRYPRPAATSSMPPRYSSNSRSGGWGNSRPRRMPHVRQPVLRAADWIEVAGWGAGPTGEILPGRTVVRYPAAFGAGSAKAREGFEQQWDVAISSALEWRYEWSPAGNAVVCEPSPALPTFVSWRPDPEPIWSRFPLGIGPEGVVHWDVEMCPHCLVAGTTGAGKTVAQRVMAAHALLAGWEIIGLDPKRVELGWLKGLPGVRAVASEFEEMAELVTRVEAEMQLRFRAMEVAGVNDFRLLAEPPAPVLVIIDEVTEFLSAVGGRSDQAKAEDALRALCAAKIQSIGRLSRATGIHLLLATQRPDAAMGFSGNLKHNLDARLACGRMDEIPSRMVLDSDAARQIPPVKGRAVFRQGGTLVRVQVFFAEGRDVAGAATGNIGTADQTRLAGPGAPGNCGPGARRSSLIA